MLRTQIFRLVVGQLFQNVIKRNINSVSQLNNLLPFTNQCRLKQDEFISPLYTSLRFYAKGKDRKKEKGKKKVEINESQLAEIINLDSLKGQMQKAVDSLKDEYVKNLSIRSTTGAIESIQVHLDGKDYTLQELAQIIRKNPNIVIVNMSTFPQAIPAALKALSKSGMNLNPQQDGTALYIPVPKVTKEHRENLSKNARTLFLKCKDHIREAQIKSLKNVKRQESLAEDISRSVQDQIVSFGDQYIIEAEKIMISKQTELIGKE